MQTTREYKLAQELASLANDVSLKILDCNNKGIKFEEQDLYRLRSARSYLISVRDRVAKHIVKGH